MDEYKIKAYGKINLGLDVTGIRSDGYHEVRMIMQTVGLYDDLIISRRQDDLITMKSNLQYLPVDDNNLCIKAARLMIREFALAQGYHIHLHKRIPVAAGMAGGSTDAAAVMKAINKMEHLNVSLLQLMHLGLELGADVPYCLMQGTALAEGIGEKLTPLPAMMKIPVVLAKPQFSVSTSQVYHDLDELEELHHPDMDALLFDLRARDLKSLSAHMGNVLEEVTIPKHSYIGKLKQMMIKYGASGAMMSGSGPTVFGLFESMEDAKKCADKLKSKENMQKVYVTKIKNIGGKI